MDPIYPEQAFFLQGGDNRTAFHLPYTDFLPPQGQSKWNPLQTKNLQSELTHTTGNFMGKVERPQPIPYPYPDLQTSPCNLHGN